MRYGHPDRLTIRLVWLFRLFGVAAALVCPTDLALAQPKKGEIALYTKVNVTAMKPDKTGKQMVTVTLVVEKDFFVFANPVGNEDFELTKIRVGVTANGKPTPAEIAYPPGITVKDQVIGNYNVYKGQNTIPIIVVRPPGDTGPLQVAVVMQGIGERFGY